MAAIKSKRVIFRSPQAVPIDFTIAEKREIRSLLRRSWQNLLERQFKNEGEAILGKRTGYIPWKERANPIPVNDDNTYTRRLSIGGKKELVQFSGRPLLQLSYPTLLTRYKRNVEVVVTKQNTYNISLNYPLLSKGADAKVHQVGYERVRISEGVPRAGLPSRPLNLPSFKLAAQDVFIKYITIDRIAKLVRKALKNSQITDVDKLFDSGVKQRKSKGLANFIKNNNLIPF